MRVVTPRTIIEKAKIRADLVYSNHTSDAEALILLDDAYKDLYSLMSVYDESLFAKTVSLTLENYSANLPQDFLKIVSVSLTTGGVVTKLSRISIQDRVGSSGLDYIGAAPVYYLEDNKLKVEGVSNSSVDLIYIPLPPDIVSLDQQIQIIYNEDQYLQGVLWKDMLAREESDTKAAELFIAMATMRIKNQITPRARDNTTIIDVYSSNRFGKGMR